MNRTYKKQSPLTQAFIQPDQYEESKESSGLIPSQFNASYEDRTSVAPSTSHYSKQSSAQSQSRRARRRLIKNEIENYEQFKYFFVDKVTMTRSQLSDERELLKIKQQCSQIIKEHPSFKVISSSQLERDILMIIEDKLNMENDSGQSLVDAFKEARKNNFERSQSYQANEESKNNNNNEGAQPFDVNDLQVLSDVTYSHQIRHNSQDILQNYLGELPEFQPDDPLIGNFDQNEEEKKNFEDLIHEEDFQVFNDRRIRQTEVIERSLEEQIMLIRAPTEESLQTIVDANKELVDKEKKKYKEQGEDENVFLMIKRKTIFLQQVSKGVFLTQTLGTSLSFISSSISHTLFFMVDVFVIYDLKKKGLLKSEKMIKVLAAKFASHLTTAIAALGGATIGLIIGNLICPGIGGFVGIILGSIALSFPIEYICEVKILKYLREYVENEKPKAYYIRALKKIGFKRSQLKKLQDLTDDDIQYQVTRQLTIHFDPREKSKKKKTRNEKIIIETIVAREVIQRFRHPELVEQQLQQVIIENYEPAEINQVEEIQQIQAVADRESLPSN